MKIWNWLNGKKTVIGTAAFILAYILKEYVIGFYHVDASWIDPTISTLNDIGLILGGTGLIHKATKK